MIDPKHSAYENANYFKDNILTDRQYENINRVKKAASKFMPQNQVVVKTSTGYIKVPKDVFDKLCREAGTSRSEENGDINACIAKIVSHKKMGGTETTNQAEATKDKSQALRKTTDDLRKSFKRVEDWQIRRTRDECFQSGEKFFIINDCAYIKHPNSDKSWVLNFMLDAGKMHFYKSNLPGWVERSYEFDKAVNDVIKSNANPDEILACIYKSALNMIERDSPYLKNYDDV